MHGLSRKKEYNIYVRAVCSDQYRYKYLQNSWTQVSESEFTHDAKKMISKHPSSPQTGTKWMAKDVDFKSLKITHYAKSKGGDVSVVYASVVYASIVRIHILLCFFFFLSTDIT